MELSRQDERLVTVVNEQSNCTNLPRPTDYLLMREELGIVRRDPVFEAHSGVRGAACGIFRTEAM